MINIEYLCKGYNCLKQKNPLSFNNLKLNSQKNRKLEHYRLATGFKSANDSYILFKEKYNI